MDKLIKQRKALIEELKEQGINDEKVLRSMLKIPRHLFVPKELMDQSYGNYPLGLGKEQTISQPYTVAFMLENLELEKGDKVFEIGTASGWNACLIAEIIKPGFIYTTEIIPELVKFAENNLKKLNIKNVKVIHHDGSKGLKEYAPFDKIIITAASGKVPDILFTQLKYNGILIAPVGHQYLQNLMKYRKNKKIESENLGDFVFVPLKET